MNTIPFLDTDRLVLRPFSLEDAARVKELAGEWEIAETTANMPHPYGDGIAEEWISGHAQSFSRGEGVVFAITLKESGLVVGAISLVVDQDQQSAEMGFWIGRSYWNRGYCTEAARKVIRYAFENLNINRLQARHMIKNASAGRVMLKAGMSYEGTLRQSIFRWGRFEDVALYSILRQEYPERFSPR